MPTDANGNFSLPPSYFVANGDTVLPVQHNPPLESIADGLTNRVMKDGRTVMTGNLQMGGFKVSGMDDGTNPGDAVNKSQMDAAAQTLEDGKLDKDGSNVGDATAQAAFRTAIGITALGLGADDAQTITDFTSADINSGRLFMAGGSATGGPGEAIAGVIATYSSTRFYIIGVTNAGVIWVGDKNGETATPTWRSIDASIKPGWDVIIEDQKPAGTNGGSFAQSEWRTRVLNTLALNRDTLASLSSSEFTLPAGTYQIEWSAPANRVGGHKTRLLNVTDSSVVGFGTTENTITGSGVTSRSEGAVQITLSGSTAFRLEHRCDSTFADGGFGSSTGWSQIEVYSQVKIKKVA